MSLDIKYILNEVNRGAKFRMYYSQLFANKRGVTKYASL